MTRINTIIAAAVATFILAVALGISGLSVDASPSRQADTPTPDTGGSTVINNYYGINCGSSDTPCYITWDSFPYVQVQNEHTEICGSPPHVCDSGYLNPLPVAVPTPLQITSTASLPVTFPIPVAITSTIPISTVNYPRPWQESNGLMVAYLLTAIFVKLFALMVGNWGNKNLMQMQYKLLYAGLFCAIDILVMYPWTLQNVTPTIYAIPLVLWIFLSFSEDIIKTLTSLFD